MKENPSEEYNSDENNISKLLNSLVEQASFQNRLLAAILQKIEVSLCCLEKISKQTCLTLNEVYEQTKLQKSLKENAEFFTLLQKHCHPGETLQVEQIEKLKKELLKCCPEDEPKLICNYESCGDEGGYKPKTRKSNENSEKPQSVKGGQYKPKTFDDDEEEEPNEDTVPSVPLGKFKGFILPGKGITPKMEGSADDSPDPVVFGTYTSYPPVNNVSRGAADISGADSNSVVMLSGNRYAAYSTDGGATFKTINPTAIFPDTLAGGFCCDQVIYYVPAIERFIWLLQYKRGNNGVANNALGNAYRIATASPEDIINSNCTAWTYWDLTSATYGLGTNWMDYPDLSVGDNFLYLSCDVVGNGLQVTRIPLNELRDRLTINFNFTTSTDSSKAYGAHICQNTGNEVFWAGHVDNGTLQIFRWPESSNSYSWRNMDLNFNWPNGTISSIAKSGNDWLQYLGTVVGGNGKFPNNAIIGITRRNGNELWLAWTASSGDGGHGGFNFQHPQVQVVVVDINNYSIIKTIPIWNPDHAFAYPCLATNSRGEVGIALGWGGGGKYDGNTAVGILGDFVVWFRDGSTWSTVRWGDYVTARRSGKSDQMFAGFGFVTTGNSATNYKFDPYYVLFGRNSVVNGGEVIK